MAHVGNRNDQAEASVCRDLAVHGIVEIARGFPVDGDERNFANIRSSATILRGNIIRALFAQALRFARECIWQRVLAQRDLDFHPRIGVAAEHLDHARYRPRVARGLHEEFHGHHLSRLCAACPIRRDQQFRADAAVLGDDEKHSTLVMQASYHPVLGVLQHLDDLALGTPAAVDARHARHHAIAVQHVVHFPRAEKEIRAAVVPREESETIGMPLHAPANEVELLRHADCIAAVAHDLAVALLAPSRA